MVAWLVTLALLANVVASALCLAPASSKAAPLTDEVLGTLAICSGGGSGAPDHGSGDPGPSPGHCQACLLLAGFALLAVAAVVLLTLLPRPQLEPARIFARTLAEHVGLGGIHSRAPPLSA